MTSLGIAITRGYHHPTLTQQSGSSSTDTCNHVDDGPGSDDFRLAEYNALRAEILKRSELQAQLVTATVAATGVLLAIGAQSTSGQIQAVLNLYPVLVFFLAYTWNDHHQMIIRAGRYLRDEHEKHWLPQRGGWQSYPAGDGPSLAPGIPHSRSFVVASRFSFVVLQFVVLAESIARFGSTFQIGDWVLFGFGSFAVVLTVVAGVMSTRVAGH